MKKILHLGSGEELGRGSLFPLPGVFFLCLLDDEIGKINKVIMADVVADLFAGHGLDNVVRFHYCIFLGKTKTPPFVLKGGARYGRLLSDSFRDFPGLSEIEKKFLS
jgi:hypothetical protein